MLVLSYMRLNPYYITIQESPQRLAGRKTIIRRPTAYSWCPTHATEH